MVNVGIAVGAGVGAFLLVCCLCWGACKMRQCVKSGRIGATLEDILVEKRKGVKKDVVRTFPIVETSELNFDTNSKLQCPICWLRFRETDTIRQLPHCDHVFHRHCIDPVLEKQITCPVCGTILVDSPKPSEGHTNSINNHHMTSPPPPFQQQIPLRSLYSTNNSTTEDTPSPSWMLVNRPLPLPHTDPEPSSSSDRFEIELNPTTGESPLLSTFLNGNGEWQSDDIERDQKVIDISFTFGNEVPLEARQPGNPSEKVSVDSFSFTPSTLSEGISIGDFRSSLRRSREKESSSFSDASTRFSRNSSRNSSSRSSSDSRFDKFERWDSAKETLEDVVEGEASYHLPLTVPPDQCYFDVLPVVTGSQGAGAIRTRYSHL